VCCGKIERELRGLPGVSVVTVNPATHVCTVATDLDSPARMLVAAIEGLGYGAREMSSANKGDSVASRLADTSEVPRVCFWILLKCFFR